LWHAAKVANCTRRLVKNASDKEGIGALARKGAKGCIDLAARQPLLM
jgi:hypothetical protein